MDFNSMFLDLDDLSRLIDQKPGIVGITYNTGLGLGAGSTFKAVIRPVEQLKNGFYRPVQVVFKRDPSRFTEKPNWDKLEKYFAFMDKNPKVCEMRIDLGMGCIVGNDFSDIYPAPVYLVICQHIGKSPIAYISAQTGPLVRSEDLVTSDGFEYSCGASELVNGNCLTVSLPVLKREWLVEGLDELIWKTIDEAERVKQHCHTSFMPSWSAQAYPDFSTTVSVNLPELKVGGSKTVLKKVDLRRFEFSQLREICDELETICEQECVRFNRWTTKFTPTHFCLSDPVQVIPVIFHKNLRGKSVIEFINGEPCFPVNYWKPEIGRLYWAIVKRNGLVWQAIPAEIVSSTRYEERDGLIYAQQVLTPYGLWDAVIKVLKEEVVTENLRECRVVDIDLPMPFGVFKSNTEYFIGVASRTIILERHTVEINGWRSRIATTRNPVTKLRNASYIPAKVVCEVRGEIVVDSGDFTMRVPQACVIRSLDSIRKELEDFITPLFLRVFNSLNNRHSNGDVVNSVNEEMVMA